MFKRQKEIMIRLYILVIHVFLGSCPLCRYGLYHLNDPCCEFNCVICKKSFFSLNCAPELLEESLKDLVQKMVMSGEIAKPLVNVCMFFGVH